jgi:hypothetical protein
MGYTVVDTENYKEPETRSYKYCHRDFALKREIKFDTIKDNFYESEDTKYVRH